MLEDCIEQRPGVPAQIGHERTEIRLEVGKKSRVVSAQHREARVVNGGRWYPPLGTAGIMDGSRSASTCESASTAGES